MKLPHGVFEKSLHLQAALLRVTVGDTNEC